MPEETTLALPLSGEEIIESVLDRIRRVLMRDCYLNPNNGYESFAGSISIKLKMRDMGRMPEVATEIQVKLGEEFPEGGDQFSVEAEGSEEIPEMPPNEVRVESEQGVPTLVDEGDGKRVIKRVKYARKTKKAGRKAAGLE